MKERRSKQRRLKRKFEIYVSNRTVIYKAYALYALQDLHKLSNVVLNVAQNDNL